MITLAIGVAFFYFAQQNYSLFNGHSGFRRHSRRRRLRRRLARSGAVLLSLPGGRGGLSMPPCSTARARPSGWRCRRSATIPGACARSASTSRRTASPPMPAPASSPRSAACCWSGSTAASRRARSASARLIDILIIAVLGGMRHPIGAVHRRGRLRAAADLRHRPRRRRALQHADRRRVPGDRLVSPDGLLGLVGEARRSLASGVACVPAMTDGKRASSTNRIATKGGIEMNVQSTHCCSALGAGRGA